MELVIIGVGLIGGSFAKAVKRLYPETKVLGVDTNTAHLDKALDLGLIDQKTTYNELGSADMVMVSIPVDVLVDELPKILDNVGEETVVIDAGSTKSQVCRSIAHHSKRRNFLACHPIAGTEFSGPEAAIENLYDGKTNIICEVEKNRF